MKEQTKISGVWINDISQLFEKSKEKLNKNNVVKS